MKTYRKTPPPKLLSEFLPEVLDKLKLSEKLIEQKALLLWNRVMGKEVKKHTRPFQIENGILVVLVDNSVWMNELSYLKNEIIKKLNEQINLMINQTTKEKNHPVKEIVKDIRFRLMSRF